MRRLMISGLAWLLALVTAAAGQNRDLIAALSSPSAPERAMAACELSRLNAADVRRAKSALLQLLGDDTRVEGKLCREWGNWRGQRDASSPGREAAIALEELGVEALPELVEVLRDLRPAARQHAALALGLIESAEAIDPLSRALTDAEPPVRARAAWALGMIESERGVEPLARSLDDSQVKVREQAAWALGMIESRRGVAALASAADDDDVDVRTQVAWALGMIEATEGVEPLVRLPRDRHPKVREQAAWGLGMIESASAARALADALDRETDPGVRRQLVWALVRVIDGEDLNMEPSELAALLRRALLPGASG